MFSNVYESFFLNAIKVHGQCMKQEARGTYELCLDNKACRHLLTEAEANPASLGLRVRCALNNTQIRRISADLFCCMTTQFLSRMFEI